MVSFLKKRSKMLCFLIISALLFPIFFALAESMQGGTYRIISDTVNIGGVDYSYSTTYNLGDTLGEAGTGDSNSATYFMHAGFWQMQPSYISVSAPTDLSLSSMQGLNGGNSEGTLAWQVVTDNLAGYSFNIRSDNSPALQSAEDSFADYAPVGADPDYNFSIASTDSEFGFSPEGTDVSSRFLDNGLACNTGTNETSAKCWDGLSTSNKIIAQKTSSNHPSGSTVTVRFRAESGSNHIQISGNYSASIVVTAMTL